MRNCTLPPRCKGYYPKSMVAAVICEHQQCSQSHTWWNALKINQSVKNHLDNLELGSVWSRPKSPEGPDGSKTSQTVYADLKFPRILPRLIRCYAIKVCSLLNRAPLCLPTSSSPSDVTSSSSSRSLHPKASKMPMAQQTLNTRILI